MKEGEETKGVCDEYNVGQVDESRVGEQEKVGRMEATGVGV